MGREAFLAEVRRSLPGAIVEEGGEVLLLPRSTHEVAVALRLARELDGAVAGPGAVAGAPDGAVPMDLRRLAEVIAFDETSRLVHVQGGVPVAALDKALEERGLTLGLAGPAPEAAVGEWIGAGAPGARDPDDDPVDQLVAGLELVLPDGRETAIRPAPRRAVGPDLVSACIGARGKLGVVVGAHLVVRPSAPGRDLAWLFPDAHLAESARAWMRGRGVRPARTRLVTVAEGAVLVVRIEGEGPVAEAAAAVATRTARERGGVAYDPKELPTPQPPAPPQPSRILDQLSERLLAKP